MALPWLIGGAILGGAALIAALSDDDSSSSKGSGSNHRNDDDEREKRRKAEQEYQRNQRLMQKNAIKKEVDDYMQTLIADSKVMLQQYVEINGNFAHRCNIRSSVGYYAVLGVSEQQKQAIFYQEQNIIDIFSEKMLKAYKNNYHWLWNFKKSTVETVYFPIWTIEQFYDVTIVPTTAFKAILNELEKVESELEQQAYLIAQLESFK